MASSLTSERTLFLGPRIPPYIKSLGKCLSTVKKPVFRQILKLMMLDFEKKEINSEAYQTVKSAVGDSCNADVLYGALYALLKCALGYQEASLKQEVFKEDLRELKIQEEFIEDLANVVFGPRRASILDHFHANEPHLPKLSSFQWRVDVAISTSTLSRVLEPTIIFEIQLSDGRKEVFEVFPSVFHRLRFAVAQLLKEMQNIEMRSILKN